MASPTRTFTRTGQSEPDDALACIEAALHSLWRAGCALEDVPRDTERIERALSGIEGRVEGVGELIAALR